MSDFDEKISKEIIDTLNASNVGQYNPNLKADEFIDEIQKSVIEEIKVEYKKE